jgi:hypothetical protein
MNRYLQESSQYLLPAVVFIPVRTHLGWIDFSFTKRKLGSCVLFESRRTELMKGLRLEAEAKYRHSTWKANKDAEPKRPLMHTNVCVWVKCESNGTWRLGTCIKIYLFSNLKKSAPAHPRRGRCSQNKSVMLSISNLTPVWVCKGMKIWQGTMRYEKIWYDKMR